MSNQSNTDTSSKIEGTVNLSAAVAIQLAKFLGGPMSQAATTALLGNVTFMATTNDLITKQQAGTDQWVEYIQVAKTSLDILVGVGIVAGAIVVAPIILAVSGVVSVAIAATSMFQKEIRALVYGKPEKEHESILRNNLLVLQQEFSNKLWPIKKLWNKYKDPKELEKAVWQFIEETNKTGGSYPFGEISIRDIKKGFEDSQQRRDPLALDLDGNGFVDHTPAGAKTLFDHVGNGVKTSTGWVSATDGFLVRDQGNNDIKLVKVETSIYRVSLKNQLKNAINRRLY